MTARRIRRFLLSPWFQRFVMTFVIVWNLVYLATDAEG